MINKNSVLLLDTLDMAEQGPQEAKVEANVSMFENDDKKAPPKIHASPIS